MNTIEEFMELLDSKGIRYHVEEIFDKENDETLKFVYITKSMQTGKVKKKNEFEPYLRISKHYGREPENYFYVRDTGWCHVAHYEEILARLEIMFA